MKELAIHKGMETNPFSTIWWKPIFDMQKEMGREFQAMLGNLAVPAAWDMENNFLALAQQMTHRIFSESFNNRQMMMPWLLGNNTEPYIDIIENDKGFKVKAELPGLTTKDLDVSISDCALIIKGEKKKEKEEAGDNYIHRECCCGSISRTVAIPEEADLGKAKASFKQNILTVEIPRKSSALGQNKEVEVEDAEGAVSKRASADRVSKRVKEDLPEEKNTESVKESKEEQTEAKYSNLFKAEEAKGEKKTVSTMTKAPSKPSAKQKKSAA